MSEIKPQRYKDPRPPELFTEFHTYERAHDDYLARRAELGDVPEVAGISAGGMPTRVKCLHVLAAHSLGAGPGVNPLGDEALALLEPWWERAPCSETLAGEGS